jgi:hypothetical protein
METDGREILREPAGEMNRGAVDPVKPIREGVSPGRFQPGDLRPNESPDFENQFISGLFPL